MRRCRESWTRSPEGRLKPRPSGALRARSSAATTASMFARQTSSGVGGRMSSQIAAKLPISCGIRAGRAMNHQCRCSPPSPQRQTWTRPISPIDRIARSIRASSTPSSAASSSGRSPGSRKVHARLEEQDDGKPRRLGERMEPPALRDPGELAVGRRATPAVDPTLSAPRLLAVDRREQRARRASSPSNGNVSHVSTGGIRSAPRHARYSSSGVSGTCGPMLTSHAMRSRLVTPLRNARRPALIVLPPRRRLNGRARPREGRTRSCRRRASVSAGAHVSGT